MDLYFLFSIICAFMVLMIGLKHKRMQFANKILKPVGVQPLYFLCKDKDTLTARLFTRKRLIKKMESGRLTSRSLVGCYCILTILIVRTTSSLAVMTLSVAV